MSTSRNCTRENRETSPASGAEPAGGTAWEAKGTDGDRRRKKLQVIKQDLRRRMHDPVARTGEWLKRVLNGYYQYHAVPGNLTVLKRFRRQVARYWFHALGQRSQRRPTWENVI